MSNKTDVSNTVPSTLPETWPKVLEYNNARYGRQNRAMRYKHYGIWQSYSWQDYYRNVKYLALGLLGLGFQPGHRLLIIGDNAPEWYFGELAAQSNRGISVGLYSDLSAAEIKFIAQDCQAEFALVEDQEQADKLEQIRADLPNLKKVIYWHYKGLAKQNSDFYQGFRNVLNLGIRYEKEHPGLFEKNIAAGRAEDVCALVYTSGTTGAGPKGARHTYRSLRTASDYFMQTDRLNNRDSLVSYLPPAWITEQWLAFGCHLLSAGTVNFAENAETQQQDIREIAPTLVLYTSRLWERQAGRMLARIQSAGALKKLAFSWFMPVGYKLTDLKYRGQKPGWLWRIRHFVAYWLLFRPLRDSLGLPHARVCYTTGSTLSAEAFRLYHALYIPLKNIYASTEAGVLSLSIKADTLMNKAGTIVNGAEIKITPEGEIMARHPGVFQGYFQNPELTDRTVIDGWVHTGDCGSLMDDGRLVFIDRLDDRVSLPGGGVLSTQDIESRLKFSPYIKDAWVLAGQGSQNAAAVIIIDADNTGHWADKHKVTYTTFGDLSQKPAVYELIEQEIGRINAGLPEGRRIHKFVNLHKEFDPDEAELTRTRKLRKGLLSQKYSNLAAALGGNQERIAIEAQFTYQDGRVGKISTELKIKTVGEGRA